MHDQPSIPYSDIPPDREDGSSSLVHRTLIITGKLGDIRPAALLPLWIGAVVLTGWPWQTLRVPAILVAALALAIDWTLLAYLPRTSRSWGPITPPLLGLVLVRLLVFWVISLLVPGPLGLGTAIAFSVGLACTAAYATWIEPFAIRTPQETLDVTTWDSGSAVQALHISDIHFERPSRREQKLLALVRTFRPELLLLTGDYLSLSSVYDPEAQQGVRKLLATFEAPLGIYAVTGSPTVDVASVVPGIFEGVPIRWLNDEAVAIDINDPAPSALRKVPQASLGLAPSEGSEAGSHSDGRNRSDGRSLWLLGVRNTYDHDRDSEALRSLATATPSDAFRILLYHTPDLMPLATELGIDLYLCGHTHGGQISLPFYGALTTGSRWGKRYEQGRIREGRTTLYVSRGLGMEGLGAPRARFFAPPEIVRWELRPVAQPGETNLPDGPPSST